MGFAGAFFAMKKGYKVTRRDWGPENGHLILEDGEMVSVRPTGTKTQSVILMGYSLTAIDWMIVG